MSALASREKVESSRLPAKASSARVNSSVITGATSYFLQPALLFRYECDPAVGTDNARGAKLLHHIVTDSTLLVRPTSRQSATSRNGATSTRLRRSSIRSTKVR